MKFLERLKIKDCGIERTSYADILSAIEAQSEKAGCLPPSEVLQMH